MTFGSLCNSLVFVKVDEVRSQIAGPDHVDLQNIGFLGLRLKKLQIERVAVGRRLRPLNNLDGDVVVLPADGVGVSLFVTLLL